MSRAGGAVPPDLAGARCARRRPCHSLAGTALPAGGSCLTAARGVSAGVEQRVNRSWIRSIESAVPLTSDWEGRRPPRHDAQMPMEWMGAGNWELACKSGRASSWSSGAIEWMRGSERGRLPQTGLAGVEVRSGMLLGKAQWRWRVAGRSMLSFNTGR